MVCSTKKVCGARHILPQHQWVQRAPQIHSTFCFTSTFPAAPILLTYAAKSKMILQSSIASGNNEALKLPTKTNLVTQNGTYASKVLPGSTFQPLLLLHPHPFSTSVNSYVSKYGGKTSLVTHAATVAYPKLLLPWLSSTSTWMFVSDPKPDWDLLLRCHRPHLLAGSNAQEKPHYETRHQGRFWRWRVAVQLEEDRQGWHTTIMSQKHEIKRW